MLPIYSLQTLKEIRVIPYLNPCQQSSVMENYTSASFSYIFGCSVQHRQGVEVCHRNILYPSFSTGNVQSLRPVDLQLPCPLQIAGQWIMDFCIVSGDSMNHKHPPWSKVSAIATNIMVFIESTDHQRQQFPLPKRRPPTPLWSPLAAQVSNMSIDSFLRCYASH